MNKLLVSLMLVSGFPAVAHADFSTMKPTPQQQAALSCGDVASAAALAAMDNLKLIRIGVNKGQVPPIYLSNVQNSVTAMTQAFCTESKGFRINDVVAYSNRSASEYADETVSTMSILFEPNVGSFNKTKAYVKGYSLALQKIIETNGTVLDTVAPAASNTVARVD